MAIAATAALRGAAQDAGRAPSVLNTQPWRWQVHEGVLDLYADPSRRLDALDPDGRLLTISCGAALHHARVSLAAAGHEPAVERLPEAGRPDLLARVRSGRVRPPGPDEVTAYDRMGRRRTDRRAFAAGAPVSAESLAVLGAAAQAEGVRLHRIEPDKVDFLRYAAQGAHAVEAKDEGRAAEQRAWTHRGPGHADGVPAATVAAPTARTVPLRDFALDGEAGLDPGGGDDRAAEYLVLVTDRDERADWLRAGEAASAVWLAAIGEGLAASPMSDVVEAAGARALLRGLLDSAGHPQLVLRVGRAAPSEPPATPRRPPADVVDG